MATDRHPRDVRAARRGGPAGGTARARRGAPRRAGTPRLTVSRGPASAGSSGSDGVGARWQLRADEIARTLERALDAGDAVGRPQIEERSRLVAEFDLGHLVRPELALDQLAGRITRLFTRPEDQAHLGVDPHVAARGARKVVGWPSG